jgi:hypothetical protein
MAQHNIKIADLIYILLIKGQNQTILEQKRDFRIRVLRSQVSYACGIGCYLYLPRIQQTDSLRL